MSKQPRTIEVFPSWWPFLAMQLFGVIFIKKGRALNERQIRHEMIHFEQQQELGFLPFFPLYILEFIVRFLFTWNWRRAYRSISFEQEAYGHDEDPSYLGKAGTRKPHHWYQIQSDDLNAWFYHKRGVFLLTLLIGVGIGFYYYEPPEATHDAPAPSKRNIEALAKSGQIKLDTTTVDFMWLHYERNEVIADGVFKGEVIIVEGYVQDIKDVYDSYNVILMNDRGTAFVNCIFDLKKRDELSHIAVGRKVYVGGECIGKHTVPTIDYCWIH